MRATMTTPTDTVIVQLEAASAELGAMCRRQWAGQHAIKWSIPVREGIDSDTIIGGAIRAAIAALRARETPQGTCPECGPVTGWDEDGCCRSCGADVPEAHVAPVVATAPLSVSQGAALAAALDALEVDATDTQRRQAWDTLRDEFYPIAAPVAQDVPPEHDAHRCETAQ